MIKKILVPVDGSVQSINAAKIAVDMVVPNGGEIHLLFAVKPSSGDYSGVNFMGYELPKDLAAKVDSEWEQYATKIVDKVAAEVETTGVTVKKIIAKGDPVAVICKAAKKEGFDLISIGSRGIGGMTGVLGSVSSRVSQEAECPVLISH